MADIVRLTYVYKELLENNKKTYVLELTKNQQKSPIVPRDLLKHFVMIKVTEDQINSLPFSPAEMILSKLLLEACTRIREFWDRKYGIPCFVMKTNVPNDILENYRGVIVPYYIDPKLDSVYQFLEWEEALSNFNAFHLIKIEEDGQNFMELSDHRSAVSFIRREMMYYTKFNKIPKRSVSVSKIPSSVLIQAVAELEKITGLQIDTESVRVVQYQDIKSYKIEYLGMTSQYPNHIIFAYPIVHMNKIYTLLIPMVVPE